MTRLARLVIRVPRDLVAALDKIAARLFNETAYDYSYAAIVRGLIALGRAAVAETEQIAPLFADTRIARGRKRGHRRA